MLAVNIADALTTDVINNIVSSIREGVVLTIVGVIVYKLDHREAAARIARCTGLSKDKALDEIAKSKLQPAEAMLNDAIDDIAEVARDEAKLKAERQAAKEKADNDGEDKTDVDDTGK